MNNPYESHRQDKVDDSQTDVVAGTNTEYVRAWAILALLAHAMLAFEWAFTSWAPWIIPSRGLQVFCALIGVAIHGYVIWAATRRRLPFARFLVFAFGIPYLLLSIVLYCSTSLVTGRFFRRDEQRYQQELEASEKIKDKLNSLQHERRTKLGLIDARLGG